MSVLLQLPPNGNGLEFFAIEEPVIPFLIPFIDTYVHAGFPSPAEDYTEVSLDLLQHIVDKPHATFYVKVTGNSMEGAGIKDGSILVVDRSRPAVNKSVIIACVNGENTVKRYKKTKDGTWLVPEHPAYDPILVTEDMEFKIWGVVTYIISQP